MTAVTLHFELDKLKAKLEQFKKTVNLHVPMDAELQLHFITNRHEILDNYKHMAENWLILLGTMDPNTSPGLNLIRAEVNHFIAWAAAEQDQLAALTDT